MNEGLFKALPFPQGNLAPLPSSFPDHWRPGPIPEKLIWGSIRHFNANYQDRTGDLDRLASALATTKAVAITGMFGVGKSTLASQYVHAHEDNYRYIFWVEADDNNVLINRLAALGVDLQFVSSKHTDSAKAAAKVLNWLAGTTGWLLVLDNAKKSKDILPLLSPLHGGDIIITSRDVVWNDGLTAVINLSIFSKEMAADFLQKRTGINDPAGAGDLADKLGHHPLLLEIVGADIASTFSSFTDYDGLSDLEALWKKADTPLTYERRLKTVLQTSLKRLKPRERKLFQLLAFFAPDNVPLSIFLDNLELLPGFPSQEKFHEAIQNLRRGSLLEQYGGKETFSMHRAVQLASVSHQQAKDQQTYLSLAESILYQTYYNAPYNMDILLDLPKHLKSRYSLIESASRVLNKIQRYGFSSGKTWLVACYLGSSLQQAHVHSSAVERLLYGLVLIEKQFGRIHIEYSRTLDNLADSYLALGMTNEAKIALHQSVQIQQQLSKQDVGLTVNTVDNLALLYLQNGQFLEAFQLYSYMVEEMWSIVIPYGREAERDVYLARLYMGLAKTYLSLRMLSLAISAYDIAYALVIRHSQIGTDALGDLFRGYGLGLAFDGRKDEAEKMLLHSLSIDLRLMPPNDYQKRREYIHNLIIQIRNGFFDQFTIYRTNPITLMIQDQSEGR